MKKIWKKFKKDVKNIWHPFERNKEVNQILYHYPKFIDDVQYYSTINNYCINDVVSRKINNVMEITIITERPGILIGKGGKSIIDLKNYMAKELKIAVKINVKQSNLWLFYKYK